MLRSTLRRALSTVVIGGVMAPVAALALSAPAFAASSSDVANLALANVGKGAGSCSIVNSSNNSLGGTSFGGSCAPEYWCSDFVRWVWANSGVNVTGITAWAATFATAASQNGSTVHTDSSYRPQLGDAAVYGTSHVGIVTAVNSDGSIQITNGDWGGTSGVSQSYFAETSRVVNESVPASQVPVGSYQASEDNYQITQYVTPSGLTTPVTPPPAPAATASLGDRGSVVGADGTGYTFTRDASSGHVQVTALTVAGSWATSDLSAVVGTPVAAGGAPAGFVQANGTVGVATANAANGHLQITYRSTAGVWATADLNGIAGTPVTDGAISAMTEPDGTLSIYSRGSTDGGHLHLTVLTPAGSWQTVDLTNTVGTPASAGYGLSTFAQKNGTVGVASADASNGHLQITYKSSAGAWATSDLTGIAGTAVTDGGISAMTEPDGTLDFYSRGSTDGNHLHLTVLTPAGSWQTVDLTNTVGTPASAGFAPSTFTQQNGTVGVATADSANGHLQITYKSSAGAWATTDLNGIAGTPVTDGAVSAITDPDGTLALYSRGSVNGGHVQVTALSPAGVWATADLTNVVGTPAAG